MTPTKFIDYNPDNVRHCLYHDDGSLAISMLDVRRLLPQHEVRNFHDLRARDLVPLVEKRFNKYVALGGEHGMDLGGVVGGMEVYPSLFSLTSRDVMKKVTSREWVETIDLINQ